MEVTINIEDEKIYTSLVQFLKSLNITIVSENPGKNGKTLKKKKLSELKGKVSKMSSAEIDKQLNSLRNEWQRDI